MAMKIEDYQVWNEQQIVGEFHGNFILYNFVATFRSIREQFSDKVSWENSFKCHNRLEKFLT